jgi:N-acetylmuramoyl-L-alanine amidase
MSGRGRRDALRGMGQLALLLSAPRLAWGATIVAVRVWPARDYTRVTIESDQPLSANHLLTRTPPRLAVDIDGLELSPALRELVGKVRPDDPYIAGVRVGQYLPRVVRLVFDLKQTVRPQQFALTPVAPYQHRLVFDLYPEHEADPLLALLRNRDGGDPRADPARLDALGALLARIEGRPAAPSSAMTTVVGTATTTAVPTTVPTPTVVPPAPSIPPSIAPSIAPSPALPPAPWPLPSAGAGSTPAPLSQDVLSAFPSASAPGAMGRTLPGSGSLPVEAPYQMPQAPQLPLPQPSVSPAEQKRIDKQVIDRLIIVALDPGHGGEDPGAVGPTGLREKDVVLAVALLLREKLNTLPGFRVMLTRDADFFVPLTERVRKARRVQADLFVSIHADAFLRPEARGASVFALSTKGASSNAAAWMANRENAADQVGGVNVKAVRDPQVLRAMLDMSTTAQIKDSLRLGQEVLTRIGRVGKLHKGEVEQAGFAVLKAPDIPSILVETAFISNPEEEEQLRDGAHRRQLVLALASGIQRYFERHPPIARQRPYS